jgi:hypothetical protein
MVSILKTFCILNNDEWSFCLNFYWYLLTLIADVGIDVKSLAAVILRRNISSSSNDSQDVNNATNNTNLWTRLTPETKAYLKVELLKTIDMTQDKVIVHKICNLIIEVGGTIYEKENEVW